MTPEELLHKIGTLAKETPFTLDALARTLDAKLTPNQDAKYFSHFGGSAAGFTEVTLMIPKQGATNGGRVALVLAPGPCVSFDLAKQTFGMAHKVTNHPGHPKPTLDLWKHQVEKASLLLGYDPTSGCLSQATLQAD